MKFFVKPDPVRQRVLVYCQLPDDPGTGDRMFLARRNEEQYISPMVHRIGLGGEPPIWDWFPEEVAVLLGEALAPRPDFGERHLEDALTVRDRLLTLVEAGIMTTASEVAQYHIGIEATAHNERERKERQDEAAS
jgi:hypothetical protein